MKTAVEFVFDAVYRDMPYPELLGILAEAKNIENQQQGYSEEEVVELLQWLTDDNSIYSIMYGHKKYRFSTNDKDFTSKEILKQFKNK